MAKISLNDIVNTYNTTLINDNFNKIKAEFQNKVSYRDNPVGEPNQALTNLDMNSKRILNLPAPVGNAEPARLQDIGTAVASSAAAAASASAASASAVASANSAAAGAATLVVIKNAYYGAFATDPLTRPDLSPRQVGDRYFNTTAAEERTFNGTVWFMPYVAATSLAASSGSSLVGFLASGAGATATNLQNKLRLEICVDDFGAVGDGVTNDSVAVNLAATFLKTKIQSFGGYIGCPYYLKFSPGKIYKLANSINLQSICHGAGSLGGWGVIGTGAVILATCTGKTVFDALGSAFGEFIDITIRADSATAPAIGIQVGRIDTTGWAAGGHIFSNIHMAGFFSTAGILNASGEGNTYIHVNIHNDDASGNAYSLAIDGLHNIVPITDFTQTTIVQNTFDSCRQHMLVDCDLVQGTGTPLFLSNVSQFHMDGYIFASGTHAIRFLAGGGQTTFRNLEFMAHCEAAITSQIEVRALSSQAVIFEGVIFREDASTATVSMINGGTNVSSLTLKDTDVFIGSLVTVPFLSGTAVFGAGAHVFKSSFGTSQLRAPQVVFPATQIASANANTLDDYKESSPTVLVTSGTGTITTVGTTSCSITKIGRLVTITFDITITTNGTGASQINIAGNSAGFPSATSNGYGAGRRLDTGGALQVRIDSATATLVIVNVDNSYPGANGSRLAGTITYMAS